MRKLTIILIVIFLVAAAGMSFYYFSINRPAEISQTLPDNQSVQEEVGQAESYNKILSECDNIIDQAEKLKCRQPYIINQASQSGDLKKCESITSKPWQDDCLIQASFSLAIQKQDKRYCGQIANQADQDYCLEILAGLGVK
ncbi:MAG: hypothetical protein Q8O93_05970 [bacterium]|nr:hypothetical protein [bacterium]